MACIFPDCVAFHATIALQNHIHWEGRMVVTDDSGKCVEEGVELQVLSRKGRADSMRKDESLAYLGWEKCLHANMIAFYK